MRDLLFRGKRKDNGEWVESGSIIRGLPDADKSNYRYYIGSAMSGTWYVNPHGNITAAKTNEECFAYEVDPETVGQYTGKVAKNGAKVFEGDIVKAKVIQNTGKYTETYVVAYHPEYCYFYLKRKGNNLLFDGNWAYGVFIEEVVGNIHNNPELLEVSK